MNLQAERETEIPSAMEEFPYRMDVFSQSVSQSAGGGEVESTGEEPAFSNIPVMFEMYRGGLNRTADEPSAINDLYELTFPLYYPPASGVRININQTDRLVIRAIDGEPEKAFGIKVCQEEAGLYWSAICQSDPAADEQ